MNDKPLKIQKFQSKNNNIIKNIKDNIKNKNKKNEKMSHSVNNSVNSSINNSSSKKKSESNKKKININIIDDKNNENKNTEYQSVEEVHYLLVKTIHNGRKMISNMDKKNN